MALVNEFELLDKSSLQRFPESNLSAHRSGRKFAAVCQFEQLPVLH